MSKACISVLLVEDNPGDVRLIEEILKDDPSGRFHLETVTDLEGALECLSWGGIDAVLLDLSLPDSQGIETFNRVHAHSPQVPIVVLTGLNDDAVAAQTLRSGGQDFLHKGVLDLSTLHQSILHAMQRAQALTSPTAQPAVEVANRPDDEFLAVLGQELNEHLTAIRSGVTALEDGPDIDSNRRAALAGIRDHLDGLARLVDTVRACAPAGSAA